MKKQDELFIIQELRHYTRLYFEAIEHSNAQKFAQNKEYFEGFARYCKENIYKYSQKLIDLKGGEDDEEN